MGSRRRFGDDFDAPLGVERPERGVMTVAAFARSPAVVAWVLKSANGRCEACGGQAPFVKDDGVAFLEVHHLLRLADGGPDTVDNAVAACPNCHRALHLAANRRDLTTELYGKVARLRVRG